MEHLTPLQSTAHLLPSLAAMFLLPPLDHLNLGVTGAFVVMTVGTGVLLRI